MVDIPQNKTICKKTAVNWYPDQDPPSGVKSHLTFPLGSDQKVGLCTVKLSNEGVCEDDSDCTTDPSPVGTEYESSDCTDGLEGKCKMIDLIITITNALSGLAAIVIVAMIVWGGIQYSMAGADPSKVQAARQKITNALLALLLLVFGFSIIQWLVPGGLI
jgi:hypothetical protein